MQPLRRPITQSVCIVCSHLRMHRAKSSSAGTSAASPRDSKPAPTPSGKRNPPKKYYNYKRKPKDKPPAEKTATTQSGTDTHDVWKIQQARRVFLAPKKEQNAHVDERNGSKTADAVDPSSDLDTLPTLTPRQHISATGSPRDPSRPSSAESEYPPEPTRPPSFVPRISIPAEELIAQQARTRALKEWSDLDIDFERTPSTPEFMPSISEYSPTPNIQSLTARYARDSGDIYPQPDRIEGFAPGGENPTRQLQLRHIGTTPLPSDIYRLIADKEHIPRWRNEEVHFSAFWGRNPRTLNKEGEYHLIWPEGSSGQLSDASMEQKEGIPSRKGAGRGPAESRAEAFRQFFVAAVREGDRFPAAIHAREESLENSTQPPSDSTVATTSTSGNANSTSSQQRPPIHMLRPHQTIPLPYPSPNPSASYLPTKQLIHGNIIYLNLLTSSRPPCPPGCAVLLSTSSQGGSTPATGKIPRTREILLRLMAEEFELIGSITHDTSPQASQIHKSKEQGGGGGGVQDDEPPDAASVGGTNSLAQLSDYIPNYQHFANRGKWNTESLLAGASEERFGVTRFVLTREEDGGSFSRERRRKEPGRKAAEKREIVGAEGKWVVRLVSRAEAGRLVRAWHMKEYWTRISGEGAEKVVMRAEIL